MKTHKDFGTTSLEPLEGYPMVSANCWNVIEQEVARSLDQKDTSFLEWGAGNSTIALIELAFKHRSKFNLTSVEHATGFFPWLASSIVNRIAQKGDLVVEWCPVEGHAIALKDITKYVQRHRKFDPVSFNWQVRTGSKRLTFIEGLEPNFKPTLIQRVKGIIKLGLIFLSHFLWLLAGAAASLHKRSDSKKVISLANANFATSERSDPGAAFFTFFTEQPRPGCLTVRAGHVHVDLWHLPQNGLLFLKDVLFDGSVRQLANYVEVPLEHVYDFVFVDGRARIPCLKRVIRDGLLSPTGTLFVHDAFRPEMQEIFKELNVTPMFIHGTNKTVDGQMRWPENGGLPLVFAGDDLERSEFRILKELFLYKKDNG